MTKEHNDKIGDEFPNKHWLGSLYEMRSLLEEWWQDYIVLSSPFQM